MLDRDNWATDHDKVFTRKVVLLGVIANAVRLTHDQLQESQRQIYNSISKASTAKMGGDYKEEYHNNCNAHSEAERIVQYAKEYADAVNAYFYLRMIDTQGENRELIFVD